MLWHTEISIILKFYILLKMDNLYYIGVLYYINININIWISNLFEQEFNGI